jgi:hypothetical protein
MAMCGVSAVMGGRRRVRRGRGGSSTRHRHRSAVPVCWPATAGRGCRLVGDANLSWEGEGPAARMLYMLCSEGRGW